MELNYKDIGIRVKRARLRRGLTQEQLAEKVNLETNSISHVETGNSKVSLPSLIKIANALDTPIEIFLCGVTTTSKVPLENVFAELIEDCDPQELRMMADLCTAFKHTYRKNKE